MVWFHNNQKSVTVDKPTKKSLKELRCTFTMKDVAVKAFTDQLDKIKSEDARKGSSAWL